MLSKMLSMCQAQLQWKHRRDLQRQLLISMLILPISLSNYGIWSNSRKIIKTNSPRNMLKGKNDRSISKREQKDEFLGTKIQIQIIHYPTSTFSQVAAIRLQREQSKYEQNGVYFIIFQIQLMDHFLYSFLLLLIFSQGTISSTIILPTNIQAKTVALYPFSNNSISSGSYKITFSLNIGSIPSFAQGLQDYGFQNSMKYQNFRSERINQTSTSLVILFNSDSSSALKKLSISYIAIWNSSNIFALSRQYKNMSTLMTGSGPRTFPLTENFTFAGEVPVGLAFLKGFTFNSSADNNFMLNIAFTGASLTSFSLQIATYSKCYISAIQLDILFYYQSKLSLQYVFNGSSTFFGSQGPSQTLYYRYMLSYSTSQFIIGLRGLYGFNLVLSTITWRIQSIDTANDAVTIELNRTNIQSIDYSYFQIGMIYTPPVYPQNDQTPAESGSYLGVIVGLITAVFLIAGGIVIAMRCYYKHSQLILPEKNDFRMLPSLSF